MIRSNVEFDQEGNLRVSKLQEIASRCLVHVFAIFFYLAPLALGLHHYDFFRHSPLINFSSKIIGFVASLLAWIPGFFIMGIVFGKFTFAKEVFRLYSHQDFSIAIAFVFLISPIAVFMTRIINRTVASNVYRRGMFYVVFFIALMSFVSFINYVEPLKNDFVYLFSCLVVGLIHFVVFVKNSGIRKPR